MTLVWDEAANGKVNEERTATLTFKFIKRLYE